MSETILKERDTCYACVVRCKRVVEVTDSRYEVNPQYGGPEYETLSTFGSYCGIDDLEAVSFANQLCNMYGLDTIACGATIAWAMDCFERGLITLEDTDGVELRFGNSAAMVEMVKKIALRDGFGDVLAEGSSRAAVRIGKGTEDLAVTVKNTELPAHMPQVKPSLALIYAVNPFGADHQSTEHDSSYADYPERMAMLGLTNPEQAEALNNEKVRFALTTQYLFSALDTLNLCQFVYGGGWELYGPDHIVNAVRFITGWDIDIDEVLLVGERRLNMLRAFNTREGFGREQDKLPKKVFQPLKGGESDGLSVSKEEVEAAMDVYFGMAGWDIATGHPTRKKLADISLGWVADLLEAAV
jgi:aldehyde:ferredoxin oxidoreductase